MFHVSCPDTHAWTPRSYTVQFSWCIGEGLMIACRSKLLMAYQIRWMLINIAKILSKRTRTSTRPSPNWQTWAVWRPVLTNELNQEDNHEEKAQYIHNPRLRNACCSLRPSATEVHAGTPKDPLTRNFEKTMNFYVPFGGQKLTSIRHRPYTVSINHTEPITINLIQPVTPTGGRCLWSVPDQRTSESCACASERAQRRRYEAVCEIQFRQNSIVWMTWWITTSPKSSWSLERQ